jgi:hypothetical protein
MDNFFHNVKHRRCCGLTLTENQCNRYIVSFSPGIYFCHQHGNIIISPYHNVLYGYINEHCLHKLLSNRYFSSKTYNRNLSKRRYIKIFDTALKKHLICLNIDVINIILQYL